MIYGEVERSRHAPDRYAVLGIERCHSFDQGLLGDALRHVSPDRGALLPRECIDTQVDLVNLPSFRDLAMRAFAK